MADTNKHQLLYSEGDHVRIDFGTGRPIETGLVTKIRQNKRGKTKYTVRFPNGIEVEAYYERIAGRANFSDVLDYEYQLMKKNALESGATKKKTAVQTLKDLARYLRES